MDDLIQRTLRGTASDTDHKQLAEWRAASPDNERRFNEIRRLWELTDPARGRARRPAPSAATIIALAEASERRTARPAVRWAALAAAAVLALAAGFGWLRLRPAAPAGEVYAAGDSALTVTLADGSFAQLGPASRLEYRSTDAARELTLTGTAFFAVAHRPDQPLTVQTGQARTTVLGTRFQVRQRGDSVRVAVVQGAVSMATHAGAVRLERGQIGLAAGATTPSRRVSADILAELDGLAVPLLYQRTPFAQVVAELARRFGRRIEVTDSALAALPVTARFEHERFDDAMTAVCLIVRARCRLDLDSVRIDR